MDSDIFAAITAGDSETVRLLVAADPALATTIAPNGVSAILFALYNEKKGPGRHPPVFRRTTFNL